MMNKRLVFSTSVLTALWQLSQVSDRYRVVFSKIHAQSLELRICHHRYFTCQEVSVIYDSTTVLRQTMSIPQRLHVRQWLPECQPLAIYPPRPYSSNDIGANKHRYQERSNRHKVAKRMTTIQLTNRRTVLKTLSGGAVGSLALVGTGAAADDTFANQLNTVRSFTRQYKNIQTAMDSGYEFFDVLPPVGHIYANPNNIGNTGLTKPPSLLFYAPPAGTDTIDESDLILAGHEYHVSGDQTSNPPNIFDDESASRKLKVSEVEGWHRSPIPDILDVTGLHVWVHLQNPKGVFHTGHRLVGD